jgi:amino acid transporter
VAIVTLGALALSLLTGLLPSVKAMLNDAVNVTSVLLGLTFITTGACCVVHFARKGVPLTDPTRIVLPALGTIAVFVLLIVNFQSSSLVDKWASVSCVIVGIVYALVSHRLVARSETKSV